MFEKIYFLDFLKPFPDIKPMKVSIKLSVFVFKVTFQIARLSIHSFKIGSAPRAPVIFNLK